MRGEDKERGEGNRLFPPPLRLCIEWEEMIPPLLSQMLNLSYLVDIGIDIYLLFFIWTDEAEALPQGINLTGSRTDGRSL